MKQHFHYWFQRFAAPFAAVIITASWTWNQHVPQETVIRLLVETVARAAVMLFAFYGAKRIVRWLLNRFQRHPFWETEFLRFVDIIFLVSSAFSFVILIENELGSVIYTAACLVLLFFVIRHFLSRHPAAQHWLHVYRAIFLLVFFLFLLQSAFQYTAYHYYLLENHLQQTHAVLLRSLTMTSAWVLLFSLASVLYAPTKRLIGKAGLVLWSLLFIVSVLLWVGNIGILYFSGIYLSPTVFDHTKGAADVAQKGFLWLFLLIFLVMLIVFFVVIREVYRAHQATPRRYWSFYNAMLILGSVLFLVGFAVVQDTPEAVIARSFYQRLIGTEQVVELPDSLQNKLRNFGFQYNTEEFYVNQHERIFTETKQLLPEQFTTERPNILLVFVESFSARFNSTYNPDFPGLTPGFDAMAAHEDTTIFHNYYNASTPTMTGMISALCSFLPPTGHSEVSQQGKFQHLRLSCLPDMLKEQAAYAQTTYITSVDKEYSNKETIFESTGIDQIYGTQELAEFIAEEPLSWGYSDHQVMPVTLDLMKQAPQPFFFTTTTIDTHPPFNISKDVVPYGDGKHAVLNMFHTTDDAFNTFWRDFLASDLANNTIVVVTGDHAVFPSTPVQKTVPQDAKTLSFYDEMPLLMYIPNTVLPKEVDVYSSSIDLAPTLMQMLNVNTPNAFDGLSIFGQRPNYPNLIGMHELGLYMNQTGTGEKPRDIQYSVPAQVTCGDIEAESKKSLQLTMCELLHFYNWKRSMLQQGRLWYQE